MELDSRPVFAGVRDNEADMRLKYGMNPDRFLSLLQLKGISP
jgi:hypothetical protein